MATKKYWKGIDELNQTPAFVESRDNEFPQSQTVEQFLGDEKLAETSTERRDFLKFLGFSVAAATVAACEAPVTKAVPYVIKPENVTPGMPTWYASTYYDGNSYASIMVKTREGRPIYIRGNADHGFTKGAVTPQIVASVLGLYDGDRLTAVQGAKDWVELDNRVINTLKQVAQKQGKVAFVSNTIISPSVQNALVELSASIFGPNVVEGMPALHPNFMHIQYDAASYNGMREANMASFGTRSIPDYDFTQAKTIVSIGADFLSTWLMGNAFSADYGMRRKPEGEWMNRHFQFESIMSITGSNADYRGMIRPSEQAAVLSYLLEKFGVNSGVPSQLSKEVQKIADEAVKSLKASGKMSLVVCGSNNTALQILTNKLNSVLGAYGTTLRPDRALNLFQSEDAKMQQFVSSVINGQAPDAIILYNVNPVYNMPEGDKFGQALVKAPFTVAISTYMDETASKCQMIAADHHALESWMDHNPKAGHYALSQPTIRPLHDTASALESLLVWAGKARRGGKDSKVSYDYISKMWETYGFPMQKTYTDFGTYFNMAVHNSVVEDYASMLPAMPMHNDAAMGMVAGKLPKAADVEVILYQKAGIGTGDMGGNPWLQEMPDPITKVTWDNYITMNPVEMKDAGYVTTFDQEHGLNMATVKINGMDMTLPVYPSPGQAKKTLGIALGYGRGANNENIGKAAYVTKPYGGFQMEGDKRLPVGKNAYRFLKWENGNYTNAVAGTITKAGDSTYPIAATQIHHTVMARHSIVRETTFDIFKHSDKDAYNPPHLLKRLDEKGEHVSVPLKEFDLWDAHPVENVGHRWGMTIDLSQCFGCGSCLIACQSENNVPVVGKDEVRRGREMHWLRIDRYFSSDEEVTIGTRRGDLDYHDAEHPSLNPKVIHMPMLCHHCNHAPCETVCPVAATTHSNEGLNQMVYNRCIGTRYCANNCPYKVRRFNWFNYPSYKKFTEINPAQDDLGRMVLNPDVTVRTRGVMEKCSLCVQRIQAGKLDAKTEMRPVKDGDFITACAEACPADAIIVGDWNDMQSMIRKSADDKRSYQALEEIGVKPNVWYKVKVRNEKNAELEAMAHEAHGE